MLASTGSPTCGSPRPRSTRTSPTSSTAAASSRIRARTAPGAVAEGRDLRLKPEMSAPGITDELIATLDAGKHTSSSATSPTPTWSATPAGSTPQSRAVETLDGCLGRIVDAAEAVGGARVITADHGNGEQMWDDDAQGPAHGPHLEPGAGDPLRRRPASARRCRRLATRRRPNDARAPRDPEVTRR